jgi:hypothetical protein
MRGNPEQAPGTHSPDKATPDPDSLPIDPDEVVQEPVARRPAMDTSSGPDRSDGPPDG